jgi:hypothetical protein
MKKMMFAIIVISLMLVSGNSFASVVFQDNFNLEHGGVYQTNYNNFTNWIVSDGTVDLIGAGSPYNYFPGNGLYVDLDGSTNNAGKMTTKTTFGPGWYNLQFDLGGCYVRNQSNTVTVSLGGYTENIILAQNFPLTTFTRDVYLSAPGNMNLIFNHAGGDNVGLILDNVKLTSTPEPASLSLIGLGLAGLLRLRKKVS